MESKKFTLNYSKIEDVLVVEFAGYLCEGLLNDLEPAIDKHLEEGCRKFLFDFTGVSMLESPGVAGVLTVTEKIVDEYQGYLAFSDLNEMVTKVLEMVGVFLYAGLFNTRSEAMAEMKD